MTFLYSLMTLFVLSIAAPSSSISEYVGTYTYSLETPMGPVNGEMTLVYEKDSYQGTLTVYGTAYEMKEMLWEGPQLSFKSDAAGYNSRIKGVFEGDSYNGIIYVEGTEIPIKATKK